MKLKHILISFLSLILILTLAACDKGGTAEDTTDSTPTTAAPTDEVTTEQITEAPTQEVTEAPTDEVTDPSTEDTSSHRPLHRGHLRDSHRRGDRGARRGQEVPRGF